MIDQSPESQIDNEPVEDVLEDEDEETNEAYCVRCRQQVEMLNPEPVWTSRGQPGTRGTCADCGTTVFRMGHTPAHDRLRAPPPVRVEDVPKLVPNRGRKRPQPATYINAGEADTEFAARLAKELDGAGVHTWFDPQNATEQIAWAGGAHPALRDCVQMVLVWSKAGFGSESVKKAWTFFKSSHKPVAVVLLDSTEVPDALRRSPRFDFSRDYKSAFRQLLQTLGDQIHQ